MESLPPAVVRSVVGALFPPGAGNSDLDPSLVRWDEALAITGEEISMDAARINVGRAPGPDGIAGRVVRHLCCFCATVGVLLYGMPQGGCDSGAVEDDAPGAPEEARKASPRSFVVQANMPVERGGQAL